MWMEEVLQQLGFPLGNYETLVISWVNGIILVISCEHFIGYDISDQKIHDIWHSQSMISHSFLGGI